MLSVAGVSILAKENVYKCRGGQLTDHNKCVLKKDRKKKMVFLVWERKVGEKRGRKEASIETLGDSSQLSS